MKIGFPFILFLFLLSLISVSQDESFTHEVETTQKPWSNKSFHADPDHFQFAIVSDRTGGHRKGIFGKAIEKLNLLQPEFVMSVGDLIEGSMYPDTITNQWAEFDSLLDPLDMRFFYVPGNHDIANDRMRKTWLERFGHTYYHFVYKNVLFLAFDSTDGDDDATFSDDQIRYFKEVLAENPKVRWTLVFMHHPIWRYKTADRFEEIEGLLANRPYTVIAGHHHTYLQAVRKERNYYVLATTGGGSRLRGPQFGEFDHITWITMSSNGPKMLNLKLEGMLAHDIASEAERQKRNSLISAANFKSIMLKDEAEKEGLIHLSLSNSAKDTLYFDGRIYHNHHLAFNQAQVSLSIPPRSTQKWIIPWKLEGKMPLDMIDPVEIDFTLGYRQEIGEPPFQINGTYQVPKVIKEDQISFTEPTLFLVDQRVELTSKVEGIAIRYTVDGSLPSKESPTYEAPFHISTSTPIKASLFDPETGYGTDFLKKSYEKVVPYEPIKKHKTQAGLTYSYYAGNFTVLPQFEKLSADKMGIAHDFDVAAIDRKRIDHYAIAYEGYIEVPNEGLYTFYTHSDDGSRVFLHDDLVVDNDGSHSARTRYGYVALKKGKHPIRIEYFEDFLGQELILYMKPPESTQQQKVPFTILSH